jgi:signal transduction histidine kinase
LRGYSKDEFMGMNIRALDAPGQAELIESRGKELLEKGEIIFETANIRKDKSIMPVEVHTRIIESGGRKCVLGVARDITERQRAEEKEKQLQQELYLSSRLAAIGELAAGVAHEINNPLTGIMGFSQRLLRKRIDEGVKKDLERIHNEAQRAARVVENLLTFARRHEPKREYSEINDILQKALELRAYELKTSNIEVVTDLAPSLPQIVVDFHQIEEVFLNIILNAEQAMVEANRGGKLSIRIREMKHCIRTSFTDDGPGIPAEHLDKLFDPFFTTRGERGGTGLGLSVCHGVVTEHGGRIYAKSKGGKGATLFVDLPLTTKDGEE